MSKANRILAALATLAGLCAASTGLHTQAHAQAWPQKPIMFVVPFAPGGGTDAFARPLAAQLDTQLGQRVLIENKSGAGPGHGGTYADQPPDDGYTCHIGEAHHSMAPSI